jgi:hypothetical protein
MNIAIALESTFCPRAPDAVPAQLRALIFGIAQFHE